MSIITKFSHPQVSLFVTNGSIDINMFLFTSTLENSDLFLLNITLNTSKLPVKASLKVAVHRFHVPSSMLFLFVFYAHHLTKEKKND